jgi:hypothetical protein
LGIGFSKKDFGNDVIIDSDGKGKIIIDGYTLNRGTHFESFA